MKPFGPTGGFPPAPEGVELQRLAIRGAGVTVGSQALAFLAQAGATILLARLITPAEFGIVTMVTTFSLLLTSFGLNGFSEAIIQWEEMDCFLASNLFWINVSVGLVITLVFAGCGSLLAAFYGVPQVAPVAVGMSATIFLTSLYVVHLALMKRAMLFNALSTIELASRVLPVALSIVMAWAGWGVWALVAGALSQALILVIGAWSVCRWIPSRPRYLPETTVVLRYALNIYARFGINYFSRNTDNVLVGWRFDAYSLGFYKKAYDLFALSASQIVAPLTVVAVASLSRSRKDLWQYKRYFLVALAAMAFLGMGLSAELTLVGKDAIRLLLGSRWDPAGRIFVFFGPGVGVMLLYGTHGWIHLSIGTADRWLRWGLVEFTTTLALFLLGLHWGPEGVAAAWTASFWILVIPAFWYAGTPIGFGVGPMVAVVWRYVVSSLAAGAGTAAITLLVLPVGPGALRIAITTLVFGTLYLAGIVALHRGFAPLQQAASVLQEIVRRQVPAKHPAEVMGTPERKASCPD